MRKKPPPPPDPNAKPIVYRADNRPEGSPTWEDELAAWLALVRTVAATVVGVWLLSVPVQAIQDRLFAKVAQSIVPVQTSTAEDGLRTVCSGVVVSPLAVVTVEHCLTDVEPEAILVAGRRPTRWLSPYRGVTLVYLPEPLDGGYRALVLRSRGPETGEPVYAVGYAVGDLRLSFAVGTVFHDRPYESDAGTDLEHEVWFDITLVAGMSGGAIVDGDGRLVSLVQGTWRSPLTSTGLAFGPQTQALRKVVRGR